MDGETCAKCGELLVEAILIRPGSGRIIRHDVDGVECLKPQLAALATLTAELERLQQGYRDIKRHCPDLSINNGTSTLGLFCDQMLYDSETQGGPRDAGA